MSAARSWWLGEISRIANEKDVAIKNLSISASDVAEIVALVNAGDLTDKLARQVVEGVIAGEGKPSAVIAARGIKVVNDDSALMAAIEGHVLVNLRLRKRFAMAIYQQLVH